MEIGPALEYVVCLFTLKHKNTYSKWKVDEELCPPSLTTTVLTVNILLMGKGIQDVDFLRTQD